MTKLYILCGYPFAGKSTIARALVARLGLTRIALDEINTELGIGVDLSQPITEEEWRRSYDLYDQRIVEALQAGLSVIVDTVAHKKEHRDKLRRVAIEHGAEATVLYVATPLAVVEARRLANRETKERSDVRDEDFYGVVKGFEAPDDTERPIIITQTTNIDEISEVAMEIKAVKDNPKTN